MNTQGHVTHLVIVEYLNSYDGETIVHCHGEAHAVSTYESYMTHHADVWLVEVKRASTHVSRRVAESTDQ